MHANKQLDMYVLEYTAKPWFWLLGAFIIGFGAANFFTTARYRLSKDKESRQFDPKKETGNASSSPSDKA
jgi:hypothetical protein